MDHTYLEENQIAERYLMGQLSAAETVRFEEHYLTCEECVDRLEQARRFRRALRAVAAEEAAPSARLGILAAFVRLRRSARAALVAALLALVVVPGVMLFRIDAERVRLGDALHQALQPQANTSKLRLSPERSEVEEEAPPVQLTLSSDPQWIVLLLNLEGREAGGPYRAVLVGPGGQPVWQSARLEMEASGEVAISFHSSFFEAGDYRLLLEGISPVGEPVSAARLVFRVFTGDSAAGR